MSEEMWSEQYHAEEVVAQYRDDAERDGRLIASLRVRIEELEAALLEIAGYKLCKSVEIARAALQAKGEK